MLAKRGRKPLDVWLCRHCGASDKTLFSNERKSRCRACESKQSLKRYYANHELRKEVAQRYRIQNRDYYIDYLRRYGEAKRREMGCLSAGEYKAKVCKEAEARRNSKMCAGYLEKLLERKRKQEKLKAEAVAREERIAARKAQAAITASVRKARINVRKRIKELIKNHGWSSQKLGFGSEQLRKHLEAQFASDMSWDNYGAHWHIDHIVPLSSFKPNDMRAWCLSNLRPLKAIENICKSNQQIFLI